MLSLVCMKNQRRVQKSWTFKLFSTHFSVLNALVSCRYDHNYNDAYNITHSGYKVLNNPFHEVFLVLHNLLFSLFSILISLSPFSPLSYLRCCGNDRTLFKMAASGMEREDSLLEAHRVSLLEVIEDKNRAQSKV